MGNGKNEPSRDHASETKALAEDKAEGVKVEECRAWAKRKAKG